MNLPEGALADRLRKEFSKVIPNFDALALLKIVGKSQIGRLRFAMPKVMVRDIKLGHVTHRGATHIIKACTTMRHSGRLGR